VSQREREGEKREREITGRGGEMKWREGDEMERVINEKMTLSSLCTLEL
jgi:hypothetical protein